MSNFPWPIITENPATTDYPGLTINLRDLSVEASVEGMRIMWAPSTNADSLNKMLNEGQACWVVEFNCPKTLFMRRHNVPYGGALDALLSFNEVRGDVYINVYVQCAMNIDNFKPQGMAPELAALDFSLRSGDIIGSGHFKVFADPDFLMAPGMRSIFKIRPAGPADGSASYRCSDDGEYFTIVLSKTLYGQFHRARQSAGAAGKKAASGLIVLPPLALLIKDLSTVDPDSPNLTTAQRRLFKLLESCGIAELNASTPHLEVAMKLLENSKVLATCFEKIS